jgi:hypothetical protein
MASNRREVVAGLLLLAAAPSAFAGVARRHPAAIPAGYARVAHEHRIPPAVLYGVALQESALMFGEPRARRPLPWPWTLNVAGTPARLATRIEAERRLERALRAGILSVDVGLMGIHWRYHRSRLVSVSRSLDPYWNLHVGAGLLAGHYADCGHWPEAVGRYHAPADRQRAAAYAARVFDRLRGLGHA